MIFILLRKCGIWFVIFGHKEDNEWKGANEKYEEKKTYFFPG